MKNNTPKLANWLLKVFYGRAMIEDILGDLEEIHFDRIEKMSLFKAKVLYYQDVLSLIFSYTRQKRKHDASFHVFSNTQNSIAMLRNYIKVALRSLSKQKLFTVINVLGLSAGMSIGILFITMIAFVQTYDDFHVNKDQIYRIITRTDDNIKPRLLASSPAPLGQYLRDNYPDYGEVVRINKSLSTEVQHKHKVLPMSGYFVDDNFLKVFSFKIQEGSPALVDKNTILLTASFAKKLFSDDEAVGQSISLGDAGEFIVGGIVQDIPKNSHMRFEALLPYSTLESLNSQGIFGLNLDQWKDFHDNYTYFMTQKDVAGLESPLNSIAQKQYKNHNQFHADFSIQTMDTIPLGRDTSNELGTSWGMEIYLISVLLTLLILLPACFNYANISTARALSRAKEIGIRKVVGGYKKQIFLQFILETIILAFVSLLGALFIFTLVRSEFQAMIVGGTTSLDLQLTPVNIGYAVIFALLTGILAGIFPAIHFAGIKPIHALKKTAKSQILGKVNIHKSLLVVQFALSFGFIMGVVVFIDQYRQTINYDLGFKQENILDIALGDINAKNLENNLNQLASIQQVSLSSSIMGVHGQSQAWIRSIGDSTEVMQMFIDHNYLSNLEIPLIAGHNFEPSSASSNEQYAIVNEELVSTMKYGQNATAIGQFITLNDSTSLKIVGVVKNFHYESLYHKIRPLVFRNNAEQFRYAQVRIVSDDVVGAISDIEEKWSSMTDAKFEPRFFKDEIDEAFSLYTDLLKIFLFLGLLAITISCLGLLGMVTFSAQQRTKEVGIRKVLGAPVYNVTYLLTKEYFVLMLIGAAIAIPISYFLYSTIIAQQNAYSTGVGISPILISLFVLLALGLFTVISQAWKTASANPTDTLRYE